MIGETIIARSNGAHLPFGVCVIQELRGHRQVNLFLDQRLRHLIL
jgi:hypothetical protein